MDSDLERLVETGKLDSDTAQKIDKLPKGAYCFHKSWGVGQIDSWDLAADRIVINFEDKPGHAMKLKFAAGSLEVLKAEHILAQRFADVEGLQKMAADDPVALVTQTVSSHGGSMHLDAVEAVLKGAVVSDAKYKSWWDATKKRLRTDRRFVVPSKRNLPLELRDSDISASEAMIKDVTEAADLKAKVKAVEPIIKDLDAFDDRVADLQVVIDDLDEAARKNLKVFPGQALELLLARMDLQAAVEGLEVSKDAGPLMLSEILDQEHDRLGDLLRGLGVGRQRQVLEAFPEAFGDEWTTEVFKMFNTAGLRGIGELAKFLIEKDRKEDLVDFLRLGIQQRALESDVLAWVARERKGKVPEVIDPDFPAVIMSSLERDHFGDETRRTNRLAELIVDDLELIPDLIKDSDLNTVRGFARRLIMSPVFDDLSRKSMLARIVKLHPNVQDLITGGVQKVEEDKEELVTSWKSIEVRKKEFDDVVNVQIPRNKKEINAARELGDLRENFEYKAAKQQEAVLRRKQQEMQKDLARARGTNFDNVDTSSVSIGTIVEVMDTGTGKAETFTILGAWDGQPEKAIISYISAAGQAFLGKKPGETAELPTEITDESRTVRIESIEPWNKGEDA